MESRCFRLEGLSDEGVIVADIRDEVPELLVCKYFGPKSSKSGWRYDAKTTLEEQDAIYSLYRRVYECRDMPNKEVTLEFARGLILMSLGKKVNWCQFREERRRYREALRKKKELNRIGKKKSEGKKEDAPVMIGRRRLSAPSEEDWAEFPKELKLSIKEESLESLLASNMGKKVIGKGRGQLNSPAWVKDDVDEMVAVIEDQSELVKTWEESVAQSIVHTHSVEEKLRRAKLLRSDRDALIMDSAEEIKNILTGELALRVEMETRGTSATYVGSEQFMHDNAELEALVFRKLDCERTSKRSAQVVTDCNSIILGLQSELEIIQAADTDMSQRITSLKGIVGAMAHQLRLMEEGSGLFCFPRPISGSPSSSVTRTHTLNACPVCSLWYGSWDYVPASCGHYYHPWCFVQHSRTSGKCLLSSCQKEFLIVHKVAHGIRPTVAAASVATSKKVEDRPTKDIRLSPEQNLSKKVPGDRSASTTLAASISDVEGSGDIGTVGGATTSFNSSGFIDMVEKDAHMSQSSHTNLIVSPSSTTNEGNGVQVQLCFTCNVKPPAVRLLSCGHAFFCFGCIKGKTECLFCNKSITGWEPLPAIKSANFTVNLGATGKSTPSVPLLPSANTLKNDAGKGVTHSSAAPSEQVRLGAQLHDASDDDNGTGIVEWCDDVSFKAGGKRTVNRTFNPVVPFTTEFVRGSSAPIDPSNGTKDGDGKDDEFYEGTAQDVVPNPVLELSETRVFKRQRVGGRNIDTLNRTRIVEKSVSELLQEAPQKPASRGKGRPARSSKAATGSSAKAASRTITSVAGLNGVRSGSTGRLKSVPAKLKDI